MGSDGPPYSLVFVTEHIEDLASKNCPLNGPKYKSPPTYFTNFCKAKQCVHKLGSSEFWVPKWNYMTSDITFVIFWNDITFYFNETQHQAFQTAAAVLASTKKTADRYLTAESSWNGRLTLKKREFYLHEICLFAWEWYYGNEARHSDGKKRKQEGSISFVCRD